MNPARARFFTREKCCPHLHRLGAERESRDHAAGIGDAACSYHRHVNHVDNPGNERKGACHRILCGTKERTTMSTRFEAGCDDRINTRVLKSDRLIRRGRGSNRQDACRSTLVKDFFWRNSEYEAEDGYFFPQQNASLIFESAGRVWSVLRTRRLQFCEVAC